MCVVLLVARLCAKVDVIFVRNADKAEVKLPYNII